MSGTPNIRIFPDGAALARAAARDMVAQAQAALTNQDRFTFVLSGGTTPLAFYRELAEPFCAAHVDWKRVHVFWGDERFVGIDDPESNCRAAKNALLNRVPLPAANIHPMTDGQGEPDDAARRHEAALKTFFKTPPRFDLVLLGLGEDGHTASLFPGSAALEEKERWVVAVLDAPLPPRRRLTLTPPLLKNGKNLWYFATGEKKAVVLGKVLADPAGPLPAQRIRPANGATTWWVDRAARPA